MSHAPSVQSLYALKVLRCQGISDEVLSVVFKSAVSEKILYASAIYDPHVTQLVQDMEDKLFTNVLTNDQHVLFYVLSDHNNHTYNHRPRRHELTLATKGDARNVFLKRQLFKDAY